LAARPFDLERIRKNWARSTLPPKNEIPARFVAVKAPLDAIAEARSVLERVEGLALVKFPEREPTIKAFFEDASRSLEAMAAQAPDAGAAKKEDPRTRFLSSIQELEELLDVFSTIKR